MIAERITFGTHRQEEFGLLPKQVIISPPEAKTYLVPVPGRNGSLDFTEALTDGQVVYNDRLIFDYDPEYYYLGRITCDASKDDQVIGTATITATCDPYKYKLSPTVREYDVKGTLSIGPLNGRMPTVPTVTTNAEITVKFNGGTIVFPPGTRKDPSLLFVEGYNHMELTGTGRIKFEYQEGEL